MCGWVISRRVGRGWFRTPALYSRGEGGLNWCLLFITKLLSFWLSPSSWMYIKYCVKYMWVELRTKNDTSEEPISDDTNIQINKSCTLCAEVSKAVIFNCLLAANINIEGISPVSNNFVRESNSAQSLMSHPFFHQHSHPPGKLDRLISDNAHTLKLVLVCTLHTLHVLLYNCTYLEDKKL